VSRLVSLQNVLLFQRISYCRPM